MTLSSGTYIIENIHNRNWAILTNANDGDDVISGTDSDEDIGHIWKIKKLSNGTFLLQNQRFRNHASYKLIDNDQASVISVRTRNPQHWQINPSGAKEVYWISDLDGIRCWTLTSNYPLTPITLEEYTRSNRQHWKLVSESEDGVDQMLASRMGGSSLSSSIPQSVPSPQPVSVAANPPKTESREDYLYLAKLAEQTEQYDEMVKSMKQVALFNPELTEGERNLLSVAYKNVVSPYRSSWRVLMSTEQEEESHGNEAQVLACRVKREKIENELAKICEDILDLLDKYLIPSATSGDSRVFYYKMKGDYHRYMAEFFTDVKREDSAEKAFDAFKLASDIAVTEMPPTHPIRLGLALDYSIFYHEVLRSPERACTIAKDAFDNAIAELDTLREEDYKDSIRIMQLLRDNLTLWVQDL